MNLLIISNNPDRASFRQRIGVYLKHLRSQGIDCTVEKLPSGYPQRWKLFLQAEKFDVVFLHKKPLNFIDAKILRKSAIKIIYDFDDAVMYDPDQPDSNDAGRMRKFERTVRIANCVIAGNSYLAEHARPFCSNLHILPTGLDISRFTPTSQPILDDKIRIVWIGSKATLGYLRTLTSAMERLGEQYPNLVLRIICDAFLDLSKMPVEKCIWSLETEARDLAVCDIGICPLPEDPFTRGKCGFKILQYQAAGLPVITSPVGVNAQFVEDGKSGFHTTNNPEWIDRIKRLVEESELRKRMGQAGKISVQKFDYTIIGKRLAELIKGCLTQN